MRYFLISCIIFMSASFGHAEDLVIPTGENQEVRLDMNEVILAGENLEVADAVWKDGKLEEAWDIFTKLELQLTNLTLMGNVFCKKRHFSSRIRSK